MNSRLEELIFSDFCGIDIDSLNENQRIDPSRVRIGLDVCMKIIERIKVLAPELSELEINLLLLQYGPSVVVNEDLKRDEVQLLDGYIRGDEENDFYFRT